MLAGILHVVFSALTANFTKTIITKSVAKLIVDKDDGITPDIATTMIKSIVDSKMNDITPEMVEGIINKLSGKGI